jgi:hypothetical protein
MRIDEMPRRLAPKKFEPHCILVTERTTPSLGNITMVAFAGVANLLTIPLNTRLPSATWMRQAMNLVPDAVVGFGRVINFAVVYREDFCVRYALDGAVIEVLDHPVPLPGRAYIETLH